MKKLDFLVLIRAANFQLQKVLFSFKLLNKLDVLLPFLLQLRTKIMLGFLDGFRLCGQIRVCLDFG